jgi:hypothetical protein
MVENFKIGAFFGWSRTNMCFIVAPQSQQKSKKQLRGVVEKNPVIFDNRNCNIVDITIVIGRFKKKSRKIIFVEWWVPGYSRVVCPFGRQW